MPLLRMKEIEKSFGGVQALRGVTLAVQAGTVHALVGENGAGKSTLMKILAGVIRADCGSIEFNGRNLVCESYSDSVRAGISMIFQESSLFENLTVAENLLFDRLRRNALGLLSYRSAFDEAEKLLRKLDFDVPASAKVVELSVGQRQIVEIAKAISMNGKLIVMDEPTASLDSDESERLFSLIGRLAEGGVAVIYISHRLDEVLRISDQISVLRDGELIASHSARGSNPQIIIREMIGREIELHSVRSPQGSSPRDAVLEIDGLCVEKRLTETTFSLRPGEVLGVAGLRGVGQEALVDVLLGLEQNYRGALRIFGHQRRLSGPSDAIALGVAYVTDDRKSKGLLLERTGPYNGTLSSTGTISSWGMLRPKLESAIWARQAAKFNISAHGACVAVKLLSGGNQQKILLARALEQRPKILVLNEPTAGIDIGAKEEIYRILGQLSEAGMATLLISSDLEELKTLSDNILVLNQKRPATILCREAASNSSIMEAAVT